MKENTAEVGQTSTETIANGRYVGIGNKDCDGNVYLTHKEKIESARKELYSGTISRLKEVATTKISRDDSVSMRCSTFNELDYICKYISIKENIRLHRVYPALRALGYNDWYRDYMLNDGDIFSDISRLTEECTIYLDVDNMQYMSMRHKIFDTKSSDVYKVHKDTRGEVVDKASKYHISLADLNLYYALRGFTVLIDTVPEYNELKNNEVVIIALNMMKRAEKSLMQHKKVLELLLK